MTSQFTKCRCLHFHWCLPVAPQAPCRLENTQLPSLRSSRFRFLQAKQGKRARALGKKEQKSRSGG